MQSVYAALTGKEIREIMKRRVSEEIDKIPGLKAALCFHQAAISVAFELKAYPADCPVPEGEFSFTINPASVIDKEDFDIEGHIIDIEKFRVKRDLLEQEKVRVSDLLISADEALAKLEINEERVIQEIDDGAPDTLRAKNDMPIPVMQSTAGGAKVETFIKPNEFKKL